MYYPITATVYASLPVPEREPNPATNAIYIHRYCQDVDLFSNNFSIFLSNLTGLVVLIHLRELGTIWSNRNDLGTIYICQVPHLKAEFTVHSSFDGPRTKPHSHWHATGPISGCKKQFHFGLFVGNIYGSPSQLGYYRPFRWMASTSASTGDGQETKGAYQCI